MLLQLRAQALLQTGRVEAGLEAVEEVAEIFRVPSDGISGPHQLGLLGKSLWDAGRTEGAVSLSTECIALLDARGATRLATSFRLFLAELLRRDGRVAQAACVLPAMERIGPDMRVYYHERRGVIRQSGGKLPEAIADLSAVVAIREQEAPVDETALAAARARLARAMAEAGDLEQAELLVAQARPTLAAAGHPDFAGTCITLAVIGWRKERSPGDYVEAALRGWNAVTLMFPADKARELEDAARTLESAGLPAEASKCRAAADRHWQCLAGAPLPETLAASTSA
jgi:hypothetical protein